MSQGIETVVISNAAPPTDVGVRVIKVTKIRLCPLCGNKTMKHILCKEDPSVILWVGSLTGMLYLKYMLDLKKPIYVILTGSIHTIAELAQIGLETIIHNFRELYVHAMRVVIPKMLVKASLNSRAVRRVIVLSKRNKKFLEKCSVDPSKVVYLPPGREEGKPLEGGGRVLMTVKNKFTIVYFGPSFSLRGVNTLVESFRIVRYQIPARLLILSRLERDPLIISEHARLLKYIKKIGSDDVQLVSGFLSRKNLLAYLSAADVIVLPFKVVPSEVPLSILEAMWMGKPVISTSVDGIPELLKGGCGIIIKPNDVEGLARAIISLYKNPAIVREIQRNALRKIDSWPTWREISQQMAILLQQDFAGEIASQHIPD